jgi:hypothetical protein
LNRNAARSPGLVPKLELSRNRIPLDVGLPDLVLELADGRRIALEITGVRPENKNEAYDVRGRVSSPGRMSSADKR